jgi:hypothetical protein
LKPKRRPPFSSNSPGNTLNTPQLRILRL